jgi:hypothetical protein
MGAGAGGELPGDTEPSLSAGWPVTGADTTIAATMIPTLTGVLMSFMVVPGRASNRHLMPDPLGSKRKAVEWPNAASRRPGPDKFYETRPLYECSRLQYQRVRNGGRFPEFAE